MLAVLIYIVLSLHFYSRRPFQNSTMSESKLLDVMRAEDEHLENDLTDSIKK